jgi:type III restriction enzyme
MKLLPFQIAASLQIAERFREYSLNPLMVDRTKPVPFYQNLSAITGSGKTVILADAIEQIRGQLPLEPIILWLSKGKVVVEQTYQNLSTGKYAGLLGSYGVKPLLDCTPADVEDVSAGLVLIATVGKFNQKDKEQGDRKIFRAELDTADDSLWEILKTRKDAAGRKRPFLIVYDEGHNLSDQQTRLLLDLNPDAIIAASATVRVPEALSPVIERLRNDKRWEEEDLATTVRSSEVVSSGLIKRQVQLGGYVTPMEIAINDMLDDMKRVETSARELNLSFRPKAIYVSKTNVVPTAKTEDTAMTPFVERQARPIVIWRHLVNNRDVDPSEIAVYCDLKFSPKNPPPAEFNLFSGGDSDYDKFIAGDFRHIIFNLTLQEGWDDPTCYFAYIDKEMGSKDQVTQVVGRVLRQPGAQHYADNSLNTAHFYIRADEKNVFEEVLKDVQAKLAIDAPEVAVTVYRSSGGSGAKPKIAAKKKRFVPDIDINAGYAREPIRRIVEKIQDYRKDTVNTVGKGGRLSLLQTIGSGREAHEEWIEVEHSNRVMARWIFVREIQKHYPKAVNLCDIESIKFDAQVEYHSLAADHLREAALKVVDAYLEHSVVVQSYVDPQEVPDVTVNPADMIQYRHAVHEGYSGLNELEKPFAAALDKTKYTWFRNPSRGFFEIPLLDKGGTKNFNPDFLVWTDKALFAIDPKADHLIVEAAARKLLHLDKIGEGLDLVIRLVTRGEWNEHIQRVGSRDKGYTTWMLRNGKVHPIYSDSVEEAVQVCLRCD